MMKLSSACRHLWLLISFLLLSSVYGQGVSRAGPQRLRDVETGGRWQPRPWDEFLVDVYRKFSPETRLRYRLDGADTMIQSITVIPNKKYTKTLYNHESGEEETIKIETTAYEAMLFQRKGDTNEYRDIHMIAATPFRREEAFTSGFAYPMKAYVQDLGSGLVDLFTFTQLRHQLASAIPPLEAYRIVKALMLSSDISQRHFGEPMQIDSVLLLLSRTGIQDKIMPHTFYYQFNLKALDIQSSSRRGHICIPLNGDKNKLAFPKNPATSSNSQRQDSRQQPCSTWPCRIS